jgi:His Kinase A (phospho-acceptor) domain
VVRSPHHLFFWFLSLTLVPAAALGWLGWRLAEQDRTLEQRRVQEHRERATDLIVTALQQALAADEQRLADDSVWRSLPSDDARIVVFTPDAIELVPTTSLVYNPLPRSLPEAPADAFQPGEDDEFRLQNYEAATRKFAEMARSSDASLRAGARLRLARNLRKAGQKAPALEVYGELARQDDVALSGVPAGLVAARTRCALLAEMNRSEDLKREAAALRADLVRGRWQLSRAQYLLYAGEVIQWLDPEIGVPTENERWAEVVDHLWGQWESTKGDQTSFSGREVFRIDSQADILMWHGTRDRMLALVAGPEYTKRKWIDVLQPLLAGQGVSLELDAAGRPDAANDSERSRADTRLPWTVRVSNSGPNNELAQSVARRNLLLAGLTLLVTVICLGSYFVGRAIQHELELARLQSDFVAAVSHEFRTPLASLNQVTEILADGRVTDADRLHRYYETQARATHRLQRLIESLLDFGRMEAGTKSHQLENVRAAEFVQSVVEEFRLEPDAQGCNIEYAPKTGDRPAVIRADADALSHALRNLLDNAVKYSLECRTV